MNVKSVFAALAAASLLNSALAQTWTTDLERAQATAREQDRAVFLFFTGSDWCGWCKALDREILSKPEFLAFANANLVLVKIDFPRYPPLPPAQAAINERLSERFHVEGFPTVCILNKEGKTVGQLGYSEGGPGPFVTRIKGLSGVNWRASSPGGAGSLAQPGLANSSGGSLFNGAPLLPPKRYNDLQLTGIMGTKKRPMIIVNNQTLEVGETARVRLKDGEVWVTCKEIRPKSALVVLRGSPAPTEIFLASDK